MLQDFPGFPRDLVKAEACYEKAKALYPDLKAAIPMKELAAMKRAEAEAKNPKTLEPVSSVRPGPVLHVMAALLPCRCVLHAVFVCACTTLASEQTGPKHPHFRCSHLPRTCLFPLNPCFPCLPPSNVQPSCFPVCNNSLFCTISSCVSVTCLISSLLVFPSPTSAPPYPPACASSPPSYTSAGGGTSCHTSH